MLENLLDKKHLYHLKEVMQTTVVYTSRLKLCVL